MNRGGERPRRGRGEKKFREQVVKKSRNRNTYKRSTLHGLRGESKGSVNTKKKWEAWHERRVRRRREDGLGKYRLWERNCCSGLIGGGDLFKFGMLGGNRQRTVKIRKHRGGEEAREP